jgi:hypothetical protein
MKHPIPAGSLFFCTHTASVRRRNSKKRPARIAKSSCELSEEKRIGQGISLLSQSLIAYLLSRCFGQLHHVLIFCDYPRFTKPVSPNEMALNESIPFEEVIVSIENIGEPFLIRIALSQNENQLFPC